MKKASEYREHAEDCRKLAARAQTPEDRAQLMKMAEAWEEMARYRERQDAKRDKV